ncbi:MAG TPA: GTP-binding protein [Firmicutes bacterium]|nr:GTP-binding protein [Bacillota bacterium]
MATNYTCPKCGNNAYETDSIAMTGTGLSKLFDVQNRSFTTVTCTKCKYTEMYKASTSDLANLFDFMIG